MKKVSAIVLAVCMLILNVFGNSSGFEQVNAYVQQSEAKLKQITFSDFGIVSGENIGWAGYAGNNISLKNIIFNGYLKFHGRQNRTILLGNGWSGLRLDFKGDAIEVIAAYAGGTNTGFTAEEVGLPSFEDVQFKLSIALELKEETDALLKIYINDNIVEMNGKTSQVLEGAYDTETGNLNNVALYFSDADESHPISFDSVAVMREIGLRDFGLTSGTFTESWVQKMGSGIEWKNVIFSVNFEFHERQDRTLLLGNGWHGLQVDFYGGAIRVRSPYVGENAEAWWLYPADVEMTSFEDIQFKLSISFETINQTDAIMRFYINNKAVPLNGKNSQVLEGAYDTETGNLNNVALYFSGADIEHPISYSPILKEITFRDFNLEDGNNTEWAGYEGNNITLENVLLSGYLTFHGRQNRYLLLGNGWHGLQVVFGGDAIRVVASEVGSGAWYIYPTDVGLSSFEDIRFKLSISLEKINACDALLQIFINDNPVLLGGEISQVLMGAYTTETGNLNNVALYFSGADNEHPISLSSVTGELYNLVNGPYLISGKGNIVVNGEAMSGGTTLTKPGDYLIYNTCSSEEAKEYDYRKRVVLYATGDSHPDGDINVQDLVATKKALLGMEPVTEAGRLGADVDRDGKVEQHDYESVMKALLLDSPEIHNGKENATFYQENVMPIGGFFGPYRTTDRRSTEYDLITDEIYKKIHLLGINLITYTNNAYYGLTTDHEEIQIQHSEDVLNGLKLAEKYGINMYVHDARLGDSHTNEQLAHYLTTFNYYQSFKGISVVDEPLTGCYGGTSKYQDIYWTEERKLDGYVPRTTMLNGFTNLVGNINLAPMYETPVGDESTPYETYSEAYKQYLEEYIRKCNPRQLSYDYYAFQTSSYGKRLGIKGYFQNLEVVRETALSKRLPFWTFVQVGNNWNDGSSDLKPTINDTPTEGQLFWNVNTCLAYGAQGIQYFPLVQPSHFAYEKDAESNLTYDYDRNGLIGADGEENQWYWYAQKANRQIALVDEVLMQSKSKIVLAKGIKAQSYTEIDADTHEVLKSITVGNGEEGAVVGVFDYHGKTAYYVVNYDMENPQTITLNFNATQSYSVSSTQLSEEVTETTGDFCALKLVAGGAALVLLQ